MTSDYAEDQIAVSGVRPARRKSRLSRQIPLIGIAGGLLAGAATWLSPAWLIEQLVAETGIAAFVPSANPPLGHTARFALALFAAMAVTAAIWIALKLLFAAGRQSRRARPDAAGGSKQTAAGRSAHRQWGEGDGTPAANIGGDDSRSPAAMARLFRRKSTDAGVGDTLATGDTLKPGRRPIFASEELGEPLDAGAQGWRIAVDNADEAPPVDAATPDAEPADGVFTGSLAEWNGGPEMAADPVSEQRPVPGSGGQDGQAVAPATPTYDARSVPVGEPAATDDRAVSRFDVETPIITPPAAAPAMGAILPVDGAPAVAAEPIPAIAGRRAPFVAEPAVAAGDSVGSPIDPSVAAQNAIGADDDAGHDAMSHVVNPATDHGAAPAADDGAPDTTDMAASAYSGTPITSAALETLTLAELVDRFEQSFHANRAGRLNDSAAFSDGKTAASSGVGLGASTPADERDWRQQLGSLSFLSGPRDPRRRRG